MNEKVYIDSMRLPQNQSGVVRMEHLLAYMLKHRVAPVVGKDGKQYYVLSTGNAGILTKMFIDQDGTQQEMKLQ